MPEQTIRVGDTVRRVSGERFYGDTCTVVKVSANGRIVTAEGHGFSHIVGASTLAVVTA